MTRARSAPDRFFGDAVPPTGATTVNLTPRLGLTSGAGTRLYGHVQIPVHPHVNEAPLAPSHPLIVGASKAF